MIDVATFWMTLGLGSLIGGMIGTAVGGMVGNGAGRSLNLRHYERAVESVGAATAAYLRAHDDAAGQFAENLADCERRASLAVVENNQRIDARLEALIRNFAGTVEASAALRTIPERADKKIAGMAASLDFAHRQRVETRNQWLLWLSGQRDMQTHHVRQKLQPLAAQVWSGNETLRSELMKCHGLTRDEAFKLIPAQPCPSAPELHQSVRSVEAQRLLRAGR